MVSIKKLNELPDGSGSLSNDDILLFMDNPSGSGITKKISLSEIASAIGGGGGADTGDITFDGIKIIGSGNASGDGNGYGTIELVPDNNLYNNNQYLIVDPTAPNHVHLRAGGTIDNSNAELILGGENSYVKIKNGENPPVQIASSGNSWNFSTSGVLELASGGIKFSDDSVLSSASGLGGGNPFDQDLNTTNSVIFDNVKLPNPLGEGDIFTYSELSKTSLVIGQDIGSSSEISANLNKDGLRLRNVDALLFDDTDDIIYGFTGITFPDSTTQNTAGVVSTNPSGLASFVKINNIVSCSQADYDSLTTPDANTFYIITG